MKKYVKPELYYENFELNQSIAVCGWKWGKTSLDKNSCTATQDTALGGMGITIFTEQPRCDFLDTDSSVQKYCYEVSTGSEGLWNS